MLSSLKVRIRRARRRISRKGRQRALWARARRRVVRKGRRGLRKTRGGLKLIQTYFASYHRSYKNRELFDCVERYCMFIGYPRSGHSLVGSLLDAHPSVIVAHELDALKFVEGRFGKRQLFQLLLDNSRDFSRKGRVWTGYSYEVPRQWQGRFDKLRIIGDKRGAGSTYRLARNPELLYRLRKTVATDIKFIHVVRNPYDNIARMYKRHLEHDRNAALKTSIELYFYLCETNASLKKRLGNGVVLDVRHESLIEDPKSLLRKLCGFLGVGYEEDYLKDCASIVFESPHKSRYDIEWDAEALAAVRSGIHRFDFLEGYSYED